MDILPKVKINGIPWAPVDVEEADELKDRLATFSLEGEHYWRDLFIKNDTDEGTGRRYGTYAEGDETAPFFSEAFLYNLLGKDEARSVLGIMSRLCKLAGVEYR